MRFWAHRGISSRFPENTLTAFRAALEEGADGIELDIQKDGDGGFRVIHDDTLDRACGDSSSAGPGRRSLSIRELSAAELESADCGDGMGPPLLTEVLELAAEFSRTPGEPGSAGGAPGTARRITVNIELKGETLDVGDFAAIDATVSPFRKLLFLVFSSFAHELLIPFSRAGYRCGLLIGEDHRSEGMRGIRRSISGVRPWSVHLPVQVFDELSPGLRRAMFLWFMLQGIRLIFWTVNRRDQLARLPRRTFAVISDDPSALAPSSSGVNP
jgi:glycerophosphoryl diester phosphodiesterase